MKNKKIYVLGVGHNTAVYIDLIESLGCKVAGLFHYQTERLGEFFCGCEILGTHEDVIEKDDLEDSIFCLSMGDSYIRRELAHKIRCRGGEVPSLVHPSAVVSKLARLEEGAIVQANSVVQANAVIGSDSVVSFNVGITHDSVVGSGVYIAGNSIVGAYVDIRAGAFIGMGSVLISGKVKSIGEGAVVGAGSVVARDVDPFVIVAGNPAKVIGKVN